MSAIRPLSWTRLRVASFMAAQIALLALVFVFSSDVLRQLSTMERAASDNSQWLLAQLEVETLQLQLSIAKALNPDAGKSNLEDVRLWFDIAFSRLTLLEQSELYTKFVGYGENAERLLSLHKTMDTWLPFIDGGDTALSSALPHFQTEAITLHETARAIALSGIEASAKEQFSVRTETRKTVGLLAIAAASAFLLLAILSGALMHLYRISRQREEEKRISANRLEMIIANSPDAIIVTNRGGWTVEFNPAASAMFGLGRAEVMGRKVIPMIFPPSLLPEYEPLITETIAKALSSGAKQFELRGMRRDGSTFPVEVSLAMKDTRPGALIVAFMRDISARKAAQLALEEALKKARSSEKAKAEFLAVMSHEMRTPLNGLIGSMDLLGDTELTADQKQLLAIMETSGHLLLSHVNTVLDIARTEAGEIVLNSDIFDIAALIQECLSNQRGLAKQNHTELHFSALSVGLDHVRGDPARLRQILLNLIGNAVKFTHDGTITVEVERHSPKTANGKTDIVEFRVIDTGIGIAPEDQARIFDDFETVDSSYSRKTSGTGLGLGIVRRLIKAMGGEIGLESEVDEGSVFWLRLPLPEIHPSDLAQPAAPSPADQSKTHRSRKTAPKPGERQLSLPKDILVVEDNEINRTILRRFLEAEGHRVVEAEDGLLGLEIASRRYFDVVLTDISMPRMDGVEVTRRIRSGHGPCSKSRIIALTAHALPDEVETFLQAGMNACLTKPVNREVLMSHVNETAAAGRRLPVEDSADQPLIDMGPLQELQTELGGDILQSLVERLYTEADRTVEILNKATVADDSMARTAHQLAGGCATFGARRLRHDLAQIELQIKSGNTETALEIARHLPEVWQETRKLLAEKVAQLAG